MAAPIPEGNQENWSSRFTFIMASVGFAVGLGNIWRFPYVVGENGGSAFVFIYLLFAFGIGVPLVIAEWTIGRRGSNANSASGSFRDVAEQSGKSKAGKPAEPQGRGKFAKPARKGKITGKPGGKFQGKFAPRGQGRGKR